MPLTHKDRICSINDEIACRPRQTMESHKDHTNILGGPGVIIWMLLFAVSWPHRRLNISRRLCTNVLEIVLEYVRHTCSVVSSHTHTHTSTQQFSGLDAPISCSLLDVRTTRVPESALKSVDWTREWQTTVRFCLARVYATDINMYDEERKET